MAERITLTGVRPRSGSIGPPGHHLRWAFASHLGFPAGGFLVYRRLSGSFKPEHCLDLSKVPGNVSLPSGSHLEGVHFYYPDSVEIGGSGHLLTVNPTSPDLLGLRFPRPLVYVRIGVRGVHGPLNLRAYAGPHLVATSPTLRPADAAGLLEVAAPYITRVTLPLNFTTLHEVCYLTAATDCKDPRWEGPIAKLPLPKSMDQALARLEAGLRNRYAPDRDSAAKRYKPELGQLLKWLTLLQNPTSSVFLNPGASPDLLRLPALDAKSPLQTIQPQSILLLAALDPNIARFLSLYWVDAYSARNGPQPGTNYDYKIEGRWKDQAVDCGLVFALGAQEAGVPFVGKPLAGDQLPGLRWRGKEPLGRVGLRWPRPREGQGAVQPVLFDLWRDSERAREVFLTEKLPVLVPAPAWEQTGTALFIDAGVPLGKHSYRLRPIDLFGQVGEAIESKPVEVQDLEAPPPPVRLRATLSQPGYPWRSPAQLSEPNKDRADVELWFEYGDAQHRQAPDAKGFRVYWRADSLFESRPVTVQIVSREGPPDGPGVYTVEVSGADPSTGSGEALASFAGGVLARMGDAYGPLPADERRRYRIADVVPPNRLRLAPTEDEVAAGAYQLVSDPRLRTNWHDLGLEIPVRPPLEHLVLDTGDFHATAADVHVLAPQSDPLALLPAGHQPQALAEPPPLVEVLLDRALLEPNLFNGGTLHSGGQSYPILYSTRGPAFEDDPTTAARVGLPPGANIAAGIGVVLAAPASFLEVIGHVEPLPASGLAITVPAQGHPAGTDCLVGGVATIDGRIHNVVQAREEADGLRLELRPLGLPPADLHDLVGSQAHVIPPQVRGLTIQGTVPDEVRQLPGGEVAFDVVRDGETVTYVARVVSDVRTDGTNKFDLLGRLSNPARAALQPGVTRGRYYAPYRVPLTATLSAAGTMGDAGTLSLPIPAGRTSQSAFLAASAFDPRENESRLSSPAQVTAVKPPPTGAPGRPYPCGQDTDAEAGYATPPDRRGRATVCLAWDVADDLSPAAGLRYEVVRALDSGILATHRRNWLLGKATIAPPVEAGPQLTGSLTSVSFDAARGLYRVELTASLAGPEAAALRGGRLSQGDDHFQVTAVAAKAAGVLELVVRPVAQGTPVTGNATLHGPPDYADVRDDPDALRQLAEANPEAFGLVTAVPIAATQFTDEVPGIGRNRYFYRVRAVDAGENRSAWSEVSVPFYQVDTTPAEVPRRFGVVPGHRTAELVWLPSNEPGIVGYHVYRTEGDEPPEFHPATITPHATVSLADISPRPLRVVGRRLVLPVALADPDPTSVDVRPLSATSGASNFFVSSADLTGLEERRVRNLNPLVSDGTLVRVVVGDPATPRTLTHRPGSGEPLVVQDHTVDLTFGLDVTAIEVLLLAGQIPEDEDLETLLSRPSLLQESGVTADVDTLTIGGLGDVLPDGIAVAVVVRLADDSLRVLRHMPGTLNALTVANGEVVLDLDIPDDSLQGVYALSGVYGAGPPGRAVPDLRLMQVSQILRDGTDAPVTAVATLNPLVPDGTAVRMTLRTTAGDERSLAGDPSQWSWTDTGLQGGQVYQYALAARRRVVFAPASVGGSVREREVVSSVAGPVSIRTLVLPTPYEGEEV